MPTGEALQDDYIVSLLHKDADDHTKRYSTLGNGPLLSAPKRRPDAPKPNTRFLKNIMRETASHNAALQAKEEAESKARRSAFKTEEGAGKRKRDGDDGGPQNVKRRRERESRPGRWASALGLDGARDAKSGKEERSEEGRRRRRQGHVGVGDGDAERSTHQHRRRGKRSDEAHPERRHRERHRSERIRSGDRSPSPRHRQEHRRRHHTRSKSPEKASLPDTSDPLSELLGPQPPPATLPRGRGAFKPSGMDSRFRDDYNPSTDVSLPDHEGDGDDWDMALEALKARTKWRALGAERLRAAGFTEAEVERWEKSGVREGEKERDVEDVRWRRRGEGREWDRGKVLDEEGGVGVEAEWAK